MAHHQTTRIVRDFDKRLTGGYIIENNGVQFRWAWCEPGEEPHRGEWVASESLAIRGAADNWDESGDGRGVYLSTLRREATKAEKAGR